MKLYTYVVPEQLMLDDVHAYKHWTAIGLDFRPPNKQKLLQKDL